MATDTSERTLAKLYALRGIFDTEGWKELTRQLEEDQESVRDSVIRADNWDDSMFLKGRLSQLDWMLNLETLTLNEIDSYEMEGATLADV